jgi:hypothetical protein
LIEERAKVGEGRPYGSGVLECYFDGANKPTQEYDRVVLAMAHGTPEQWKGFNLVVFYGPW